MPRLRRAALAVAVCGALVVGCSGGGTDDTVAADDAEPVFSPLSIVPTGSGEPESAPPEASAAPADTVPAEDAAPGSSVAAGYEAGLPERDVDGFAPVATSLPGLLPDRVLLFGQPIESIPDPDLYEPGVTMLWQYRLVGDQLVSDAYEAPLAHQRVWQRFAELIPADLRPTLQLVAFIADPENEYAGALASVGSYMYTDVAGQQENSLAFNEQMVSYALASLSGDPASAEAATGFARVAIHEFGHVLESMDALNDFAGDPAPYVTLGLSYRRDSLAGDYLQRFWEGEVYRTWRYAERDGLVTQNVVHAAYPERFVSEYAATNYHEDFAESFEHFVTMDERPESDETYGAAKLRWFWDRADMIALRERLRALR